MRKFEFLTFFLLFNFYKLHFYKHYLKNNIRMNKNNLRKKDIYCFQEKEVFRSQKLFTICSEKKP